MLLSFLISDTKVSKAGVRDGTDHLTTHLQARCIGFTDIIRDDATGYELENKVQMLQSSLLVLTVLASLDSQVGITLVVFLDVDEEFSIDHLAELLSAGVVTTADQLLDKIG